MRILRLLDVASRPNESHGSRGFTLGAFGVTAETSLVMVSLAPGGLIGRHPAAGTQLLIVIEDDAVVSGAGDEASTIGPGEAAVWEWGEPHETRSVTGLHALVVEGDLDLGTPGRHLDPGDV